MMDVSGTDPRTRTGLFLWPWASYPAVAANAAATVGSHNQSIMMGNGANMGTGVGAGILGVSSSNSMTVPSAMEDPFESFYQRFSYPGAQAHMSHILPQHHLQAASNESRHTPSDRVTDGSSNIHRNLTSPLSSSWGHGQSRSLLMSPQPRHPSQGQHSELSLPDPINIAGRTTTDSHASAITVFASVSATSNTGSSTENGMNTGHTQRQLQHDGSQSASSGEAVHDGLCNGLGRPGMQFTNHLPTGGPNSNSSASPEHGNDSSPTNKAHCDPVSGYSPVQSQQLKEFNNTAAAMTSAASTSEHAPYGAHVTQGQDVHNTVGRTAVHHRKQTVRVLNRQSSLDESSGRGQVSSQPSAELYQTPHPHYLCSSKSPMSDTCDHPREMSNINGGSGQISRSPIETTSNDRFISGLRDRSAALLFQNSSMRSDCSPEANLDYSRSCELLMNAAMSARGSGRTAAVSGTPNLGSTHGLTNNTSRGNPCNLDIPLPSATNLSNSTYVSAAKGYKCKICQHVCFSRHDLSAHNAAIHKQDPRPYRCEQCGRQFTTCAYLSQHRRIHTGVKPYACRYCDRRFTQLSHVQQHERIHTGEKPYRCTTCMKSFTQMSNLQSHQRQHMKGKPHRCEQCFMSFDSKEELDLHVQAKHSGNRYAKVLVCPVCTKSYNSETYLAKHMDRHKEAASSTLAEGGSAGNVQATVDDLFVAGFHNHPMAMAAAALSRGGGGPVSLPPPPIPPDGHFQGHQNHAHVPSHAQLPGVAAAADVAARCAAAAAAAESGYARVESIARPFFNSTVCGLGDHRSGSPRGRGVRGDPLNYSTENELFHQLPASLHSSRAAYLVAAAAASHQQHNSGTNFGKLPQLPPPFADFRSPANFGLGVSGQHQNETMHGRRELNQLLSATHTGRSMSVCSGHAPSPLPPYVGSPGVGEHQLLNLTQTHSIGRNNKRIAPSSSSSSPAEAEHYSNTPHHQRQVSQHTQQIQLRKHVESEHCSMVPPPAHQNRVRMDYENYQPETRTVDPSFRMHNNCNCSTMSVSDTKSPESKAPETRRPICGTERRSYGVCPSGLPSGTQSPNLAIPIPGMSCKREAVRRMTPDRETENNPNSCGRPDGQDKADIRNNVHAAGELQHPIRSQQLAKQSPEDEKKGDLAPMLAQLHQQKLNEEKDELHVDVSMESEDPMGSGSPNAIDSLHNGTQTSGTPHIKVRHGRNPTAPLLTPHATPGDSVPSDRVASAVVSELAKMTPRSKNTPVDSRLPVVHSPSPESGTSADLMTTGIHDPSNTVTKADYMKHSVYLCDRPSNSSSPLSVETKVPMTEHVRNSHARGSPGMFDEGSQAMRNMFYFSNTPIEDPIKSSWASKELIPPKSTSVDSAMLRTRNTTDTRASIGLSPDRTDYIQAFNRQLEDDGMKTSTMNVPFYLNSAWRQHNREEHRIHRIEDFVTRNQLSKQKNQSRHSLSPTTPPPSPTADVTAGPEVSPSSGKRRRRHQYTPQHVAGYEASGVHSSIDSGDVAYSTYYRAALHQRLSDDYDEASQSLSSNQGVSRTRCPSTADGSPMTGDYNSEQTGSSRPIKAPPKIATAGRTEANTGHSLSHSTGFSFRPQV